MNVRTIPTVLKDIKMIKARGKLIGLFKLRLNNYGVNETVLYLLK